jgi:hypothetical protein
MKCPDAVVLAGRRIELQNCLPRDEGQARLSRLPPGTGPESPAQPLIRVEEEGAWRPTRPESWLGRP